MVQVVLIKTREREKTEQPALQIQPLPAPVQALLPQAHLGAQLRWQQRATVATGSKSVRCLSHLGDDACMVSSRLAHAALSSLSERVAQPIEKPYKAALAPSPARRPTNRPRMHRNRISLLSARPGRAPAPAGASRWPRSTLLDTRLQALVSALVLSNASCSKSAPTGADTAALPGATAPVAPPSAAPVASTRLAIPEGSFNAGTEPGQDERRPELEPQLARTALGPFEIDTRPYPGTGTPELRLPRAQARAACEARRGRLCTELEWERACKGPQSERFAGSAEWDPLRCAAKGCVSGFGALGMGSLPEWTASDIASPSEPLAAVRGADASDSASSHRCAHRAAVSPLAGVKVGFRCCYGPPNAARVQIPALGPTYEKLDLSVSRLAELLAASPATVQLARELSYFPEPSGPTAVIAKGPGDRQGFAFTEAPLLWNPVRGSEFLVVTARSGGTTSFVVVLHSLGGDAYRLASSFVMEDEPGPIVLAYNGYIRPRLHFSSCWGCPGETGKILYREPDSAIVLQP